MSTSPDGPPPPDRPRPSPRPSPGPVPRSGPATVPGARRTGGRHRFDGLTMGNPVTEGMSNTRQISNVYLGARKRMLPFVAFISVLTALAQAGALVVIAAAAVALAKDERTVQLSAGPLSFSLGLTVATVISVVCAVLMITLQLTAGRLTASLAKTAEAACRDRAIQAYLRASWEVVSPRERGELQQIMTINVDRVARVVVYRAVWIFGIANLVILVGGAFFLAPLLAIIMIFMAALFAVPLRPIKNRTRKAAGDHSDAERGFATYVAGLVEQARESRVFDVGDALADKGHGLNIRAAEGQRRVQFLVWTTPAIYLGGALLSLAVAIASLAAIGTSHLESIGPMVLLLLRSLVYGQTALSSTQFLVEAAPYLRELEKHVALYQAEVQSTGTRTTGTIRTLELDGAGYTYPGSPSPALQGVDLALDAGTAIGIVGSTGSGKSTLAEVLLALRPVSSGRYLVNGIPAGEIASSDWAHRVGYVPQQSVIFDGTLRENIRFYRPSITDAEVERAARDAHIDAEIRAMPDGYDTVVAGLSVGLSGGQRQRICIARALAGRPEILVMDEPTSGLDVRSENLFVETISELKGRTTLLIIAHRLETIRMCDRVVVVTDGHVADEDPAATVVRLAGTAPAAVGATDGHATNGRAVNGHANGNAVNGHEVNGHAVNGHAVNGHANGHAVNGQANGHTPATPLPRPTPVPVRPRPSARR